jgi:lipopolysaccharide export system permease protein
MPSLHFAYLAKLYIKNFLALLLGLAFAFAMMDYFQYSQKLSDASNYKILYIFYMWQEALGLLYPLVLIFAVIITKFSLVKHNTMVALHAFGYTKKQLFFPFFIVGIIVYFLFTFLNMTEFAYAKDKAAALLKNQYNQYNINDLFFKYNDTFVYVNRLDPIEKKIYDLTLFKVAGDQVRFTIHAPYALFDQDHWIAKNAQLKRHIYDRNGTLQRYSLEHKESITTLKGYRPKIIESLYEGKALNILDAYNTWHLLSIQHLNSDKIRALFYDKVFIPLFALAMMLILFFKIPFHARMMNVPAAVALAVGVTFAVWGILFGLVQIGANGVVLPELTSVLPVVLLWFYALYVYFTDEKRIG